MTPGSRCTNAHLPRAVTQATRVFSTSLRKSWTGTFRHFDWTTSTVAMCRPVNSWSICRARFVTSGSSGMSASVCQLLLQRSHDLRQRFDTCVDVLGRQRTERQPDERIAASVSEEITSVGQLNARF